MLTGLSLSFCVRDIVAGRVQLQDVKEIVAGTCAKTKEDWNEVFAMYRRVYWRDDPDKAEKIARGLIKAGKVSQPRLEGKPCHSVAKGWWKDEQGNFVRAGRRGN